MANVERAELHKTIWRIANDLRGSVDGWDFKSYVLGTLFYRFISENLTNYLNEHQRKAGKRILITYSSQIKRLSLAVRPL
jgi:type I restriction enzyme M protein